MKTYIVQVTHELNGVQLRDGDEAPPSVINGELRDSWLDHRWLIEYDSSERRSLHRLFSQFSGSSETEPIDEELRRFAVT